MIEHFRQKVISTGIIFTAVLLTLLFSVSAVDAKADGELIDVVIDVEYNQTEARRLFGIINEFRQSEDAWYWVGSGEDAYKYYPEGLQDFKYDYALENTAMQRAAEIAVYFSHFRPNGTGPEIASEDLGYSNSLLFSENICVGRDSAENAMTAFREDNKDYSGQGHRRSMLYKYTAIGIAYVKVNDVDYWVIDFGKSTEEVETEPFDGVVEKTIPTLEERIKSVSAFIGESLTEGESLSFDSIIPTFKPVNGWWKTPTQGIPVKNPLTFILADNEFLSMDENGINALKAGTGTITCSLFGREFTKEITIKAKPTPTPEVSQGPVIIPVDVIVVPYNPDDDIDPSNIPNPGTVPEQTNPTTSSAIGVDLPTDDIPDNGNTQQDNGTSINDNNQDSVPNQDTTQVPTTDESTPSPVGAPENNESGNPAENESTNTDNGNESGANTNAGTNIGTDVGTNSGSSSGTSTNTGANTGTVQPVNNAPVSTPSSSSDYSTQTPSSYDYPVVVIPSNMTSSGDTSSAASGKGDKSDTKTEKDTEKNDGGKVNGNTKKSIADADIKLSDSVFVYDGKKKTPSIVVEFDGNVLDAATDYKVSYKNYKKIGTATVTIKGIGKYSGSAVYSFNIIPAETAFAKASVNGSEISLKWKKVKSGSGYEIQYSTKKSFSKKNASTVDISGAKMTSTSLSELKSGKKYYIRIRTYKVVKGEKVYSGWSEAIKTKTK